MKECLELFLWRLWMTFMVTWIAVHQARADISDYRSDLYDQVDDMCCYSGDPDDSAPAADEDDD